jgi:hypothetical protein
MQRNVETAIYGSTQRACQPRGRRATRDELRSQAARRDRYNRTLYKGGVMRRIRQVRGGAYNAVGGLFALSAPLIHIIATITTLSLIITLIGL